LRGRQTDVPWAIIFPKDAVARHPSELYEATLEGLVLFAILMFMIRRGALKRPGLVVGAFATCYAVMRSFCELFREPDAQLSYLWHGTTMGQWLSVPLFIAGAGFIAFALRRPTVRSP
jgi:phosphatidylglycerol:prolipoprotein diacylglycerol transferase